MSIEEVSSRPKSFDTILMMANNIGLFGNTKKAQRLLTRIHEMTRSIDRSQCFYLARDSDYVALFGHTLESDVVAEALGTYSLAKVRA